MATELRAIPSPSRQEILMPQPVAQKTSVLRSSRLTDANGGYMALVTTAASIAFLAVLIIAL
jgi:hypothetical protein